MSVDSSKPQSHVAGGPPHKGGQSRLRAIVGLPVWVAISFIAAQVLIIGAIWVSQRLSVVPPLDAQSAIVNAVFAALVYLAALAIVMGVPYAIYRWPTTRKQLGLSRLPTWLDILLTIAGAAVYIFLTGILLTIAIKLVPGINPEQAQDVGFHKIANLTEYLLAFATLIIIAPLAEETLFRGYLYGKLRRYAPVWISILITSVLFGAAHMQWNVGIDTFALSIVLCSLREITGSIWAGILLHMLKNGIAFYLVFIMPSGLIH